MDSSSSLNIREGHNRVNHPNKDEKSSQNYAITADTFAGRIEEISKGLEMNVDTNVV